MPIYEYSCNKCGTISEVLMISKDDQAKCKDCGSDDLTKLMSAHNTSIGNTPFSMPDLGGGCCGTPGGCGSPGSCCGGL